MQKDRWPKKLDKARKRFVKGVHTKAGTLPPLGLTPEQVQANLNALMERLIQKLENGISHRTKRRNK